MAASGSGYCRCCWRSSVGGVGGDCDVASSSAQLPPQRGARVRYTRLVVAVAVLVGAAVAGAAAAIAATQSAGAAAQGNDDLLVSTGSPITCDVDSVRCDNQLECVDRLLICDGYEQCSDHSDEKNCSSCPSFRFACGDGTCLRREWKCDRDVDCSNGADEQGCDTCDMGQFVCNNYHCINVTQVCDGLNDCGDLSDEDSCYEVSADSLVSARRTVTSRLMPVCYNNALVAIAADLCSLVGQSPMNAAATPVSRGGLGSSLDSAVCTVAPQRPAEDLAVSQPPTKCELCDSCNPASAAARGRDGNGTAVVLSLKCEPCGRQESQRSKRVVGGRSVNSAADWPWYVKIVIAKQRLCGGTLVSSSFVLTAAHCVVNSTGAPSTVAITLGSTALSGRGGLRRTALSVRVHPGFATVATPGIYTNDLALLEIEPVPFGATIKPICLPRSWDEPGFNKPTHCYVVGLGHQLMGQQVIYPKLLQEAKVKIWPRQVCQDVFYAANRIDLGPAMLCAGSDSGALDTCTGDSGGPLMCFRRGSWVLAGVTSWGFTCGSYTPSIYASVVNALPWLSQNLEITAART